MSETLVFNELFYRFFVFNLRPAHHAGNHPHFAGRGFGVGDARKDLAFSVTVADEKRAVVGHVSRCVAFLVHIAQHGGKLHKLDGVVRSRHEHRTFIIHAKERVVVSIFAEYFLAFVGQRKGRNAVATVVVFKVDGLCTIEGKTGIFWGVGEEVCACANADRTAAVQHKLLDSADVLGSKVLVLARSAAAWHDDGIKRVQHASGDVGRGDILCLNVFVERTCRQGFPNAGLRPAVAVEHANANLLVVSRFYFWDFAAAPNDAQCENHNRNGNAKPK